MITFYVFYGLMTFIIAFILCVVFLVLARLMYYRQLVRLS